MEWRILRGRDWAEAKMVMMMHLCTLDPREGTKISPSLLSALYVAIAQAGPGDAAPRLDRVSRAEAEFEPRVDLRLPSSVHGCFVLR